MTHSFEIHFPPLAERVAAEIPLDVVITPVDDFTGRVVATGVSAKIPELRKPAVRSLSGHLVFERLHAAAQHVVHVDPEPAGYFVPAPVPVNMPQDRAMREVRLIRRPDAVPDGESMLVRGMVRRGGQPAEGQEIEGTIAGIPDPFRTRTDANGNFALRLRPPAPILGSDPLPIPVTADVVIELLGAGLPAIMLDDVPDMQTWAPPLMIDIP